MDHKNEESFNATSRRRFLQQWGMLGAGVLLAHPFQLLAGNKNEESIMKTISTRGYAARDESGILSPWSFERRGIGDDDVLIDIKFSGICHSDIHQLRGDWGPQKYPQVPGHEIAGIVRAVGVVA